MASLLCCPCSVLSSAFLSEGARLGDLERRRTRAELKKLPWYHDGNRERQGRIRFRSCQNGLDGLGEQQKKQSGTCLDNHGCQRRRTVLAEVVAAFLLPSSANPAYSAPTGSSASVSVAAAPTAVQVDEINAYSYVYPVKLGQQPSTIRWVESRKPERYSSAPPLAPDARQRIVSERLNIENNLVVSVSVGPPNFNFLKTSETNAWSATDVARSVLTDKSTARMTTGQRVAEISILDTKSEEKDGVRYWYYEYIVQKSPTVKERSLDVFRHSVAVTAEREGYLYSLNASTSGKKWSLFEPMFKKSVQSFRLVSPTTEYVAPYKDPWRFW